MDSQTPGGRVATGLAIAVGLLPWFLFGALAAARLRDPPPLPATAPAGPGQLVSVIIPARNEAVNIVACLDGVTASTYGQFEVIVVDDRSEDATAKLVSAADRGNAREVRLLAGAPLPTGWFGKPWACWQGAQDAKGGLLLFTDADTMHGPSLLSDAVAELQAHDACMLSLVGDQLMGSFWERLVQPQVFVMIALRFPNLRNRYQHPLSIPEEWPRAIANGQYILVDGKAYADVGGHAAVRSEVVEDLRLAQVFVQNGRGLLLRGASGRLKTRMYRSLNDLVEGWSKNLWTGSRQSVRGAAGALMLPMGVLALLTLWVAPAVVLLAGAFGLVASPAIAWAAVAAAMGGLFWVAVSSRMGAAWYYGLCFPLAAFATVLILLRSAFRGERIVWKGRNYGGG